MMKTATSAFLILASIHAHADLPACAVDAAEEYEIPEKVFHALVLEAKSNWEGKPNHYGPMGLYDLVIPRVADATGVSSESIRNDPCANYSAAAWWLMNEAGGNESEIWDAVAAPGVTLVARFSHYRGCKGKCNAEVLTRAQSSCHEQAFAA